jgi:hypothetical protein
MLPLLTSRTNATAPTPPLHILVAQNPDVSCSNCVGKGIRCTTNQIVNPAKPNKGGRRIEVAKRVFGSDGSVPVGVSGASTSTSTAPHTAAATPMPHAQQTPFLPQMPQSSNLLFVDPDMFTMAGEPSGSSATAGGDMTWTTPLLESFFGSADVTGRPSGAHGSASSRPSLPISPDTPTQEDFVSLSGLFNLTPQPPTLTTGSSTSGRKVAGIHWGHQSTFPNSNVMHATNAILPDERVFAQEGALVANRKRPFCDPFEEEDPDGWSLWAPPEPQSVRWGRREIVGESLADRSLGIQLSRHLVKLYFNSVHLVLPTVSPESFYIDWQRAGERSDMMAPAQEALCAVMEAWAARFSDNPVVCPMHVLTRTDCRFSILQRRIIIWAPKVRLW